MTVRGAPSFQSVGGKRSPNALASPSERPIHLHNRAAATRPGASGATKTVITGHDLAIFEQIRVEVPHKHSRLVEIIPLHPELLIKIAIVNFTAPADAYRVATHETFDSRWIECIDQKPHVLIELVLTAQVSGKSADRQIAEGEESVKHDP